MGKEMKKDKIEPIRPDSGIYVGQKYTWSRKADIVRVKDIEKIIGKDRELCFVEMITPKDNKYKVGENIWVFTDELRKIKQPIKI